MTETIAKIGGVNYVIGSWGQYEIDRRNICSKSSCNKIRPGAMYGGRTYIHASDAVQSIINANPQSAIRLSALHLADVLSKLEEKLCEPDENGVWECESASILMNKKLPDAYYLTVPSITSEDLRNFANDITQETDAVALYDISQNIIATAAIFKTYIAPLDIHNSNANKFPVLPSLTVAVTDDESVLKLESDVAPYINSLEKLQASVAEQFDITANAINRVLKGTNLQIGGAVSKKLKKSNKNINKKLTQFEELKKTYNFENSNESSDEDSDNNDLKSDYSLKAPKSNISNANASKLLTRGEEIELASKTPPLHLLDSQLPFEDNSRQAFDIKNGVVIINTKASDGIYYCVTYRNNPSRATLLTPNTASLIAFNTSGNMIAWYLLDSPEARYLIRASPQNGKIININMDLIINWIQPRLTGNPPHKLTISGYISHLKSYGIEIYEKIYGEDVIRFDIISSTTISERTHELAKLRSLTKADFDALDWSAYNRDAAGEACQKSNETAGDVIIDLVAKTVSAPKVRLGLMWGVYTHARSYITFHTHPSKRYQGKRDESPSGADIMVTLNSCAFNMLAWAFISAPEGTYIIRPTQVLIASYLHDPQYIKDIVSKIYLESLHSCVDSVKVCIKNTISTLTEVGFIAYFRDDPCIKLSSIPDIVPEWNLKNREDETLSFTEISKMSASELANINWDAAIIVSDSPILRIATWLTASIDSKTKSIIPTGTGHAFDSVDNYSSYPIGTSGPLFIVYFPEESQFPTQVPHAAISASQKSLLEWVWLIFLSPSRIMIFRSNAQGVEIYGPAIRKK